MILRGPKKLEKTGRQHESWRFNIANILQPYEKHDLGQPRDKLKEQSN